MLDETDTSIYFLIVEKVAVSLPTKCASNSESGSGLIGDNWLGHAHFPVFAYINRWQLKINSDRFILDESECNVEKREENVIATGRMTSGKHAAPEMVMDDGRNEDRLFAKKKKRRVWDSSSRSARLQQWSLTPFPRGMCLDSDIASGTRKINTSSWMLVW